MFGIVLFVIAVIACGLLGFIIYSISKAVKEKKNEGIAEADTDLSDALERSQRHGPLNKIE